MIGNRDAAKGEEVVKLIQQSVAGPYSRRPT